MLRHLHRSHRNSTTCMVKGGVHVKNEDFNISSSESEASIFVLIDLRDFFWEGAAGGGAEKN